MKVKEHIKNLETLDPESHIAMDYWTVEDLEDVIGAEDIYLSDNEKDIIINIFHHDREAEFGLTWEGLRLNVLNFVEQRDYAMRVA